MATPKTAAIRLLRELLAKRRILATVQAGAAGLLVCVPNREVERAVAALCPGGFKGHPVMIERTGAIGSSR